MTPKRSIFSQRSFAELERLARMPCSPPPSSSASRPAAARPKSPTPTPKRDRARRLLAEVNTILYGKAPTPSIPLIKILGEIGGDRKKGTAVRVEDVQRVLSANPQAKEISLVLNSPGGSLVEGRKIYSILRSSGARISARVLGNCCSAATIIFLASDFRESVGSAKFLLHEVSLKPDRSDGGRWTADAHRKQAAELEAINDDLARFYAMRCGGKPADFRREMRTETGITSATAQKIGMVHAILDASGMRPLAPQRAS